MAIECPVCKKREYRDNDLPTTCDNCGWEVRILTANPNEEYREKLRIARDNYRRYGRIESISDMDCLEAIEHNLARIERAWKNNEWDIVLNNYKYIFDLDNNNARAAHEMPIATACFAEHLLRQVYDDKMNSLNENLESLETSIDDARKDIPRYENAGMNDNAEAERQKVRNFERELRSIENLRSRLSEANPALLGIYERHAQGPNTIPDDMQTNPRAIISSCTTKFWTSGSFIEHIWEPFLKKIEEIPPDSNARRYLEDLIISELQDCIDVDQAIKDAKQLHQQGNIEGALHRLQPYRHDANVQVLIRSLEE